MGSPPDFERRQVLSCYEHPRNIYHHGYLVDEDSLCHNAVTNNGWLDQASYLVYHHFDKYCPWSQRSPVLGPVYPTQKGVDTQHSRQMPQFKLVDTICYLWWL